MIYKETNSYVLNEIKMSLIDYPMSQSELANCLGVAEGTVSRWLNGQRKMSIDILEKILRILDLHIEIEIRYKNNDYNRRE